VIGATRLTGIPICRELARDYQVFPTARPDIRQTLMPSRRSGPQPCLSTYPDHIDVVFYLGAFTRVSSVRTVDNQQAVRAERSPRGVPCSLQGYVCSFSFASTG
jgi:hypothetical protein